jgi:transcription elongation factor Elf1
LHGALKEMTNKNRTRELQQKVALSHRKSMEKYIGPYDCPKCFNIKSMMISKIAKCTERNNETITWRVQCGKCNFWKDLTLPALLQKIDVINKIGDFVRKEVS